ncbi:hypothetical protein SVIO_014780 [Streptomyces violaceusniger]|uniref:Uncharacterized protein n=1 Tax=Streptomyces violaceusniger TaxID=68280 RepID=A0A4D4KPM4_STRVO|nr:hypothetical protein SVIO_014780 [Streptomyces violaceusniger]
MKGHWVKGVEHRFRRSTSSPRRPAREATVVRRRLPSFRGYPPEALPTDLTGKYSPWRHWNATGDEAG